MAIVKYTRFEMRLGLQVEIVYCGRYRLRVGKRAAHTAASLQGTVNRLTADAEIVMSILNSERLG